MNNFQGVSLSLIRRFAIQVRAAAGSGAARHVSPLLPHGGPQILACLRLLHSEKIVHCDLKPENILLRCVRSLRRLVALR